MSPVTSVHRRSKDFPDEERVVSHVRVAKVAKMKEDNDKLLRAYERGLINAKSPAVGGTAKHHRRQASSHKRNAGLSPSETHHEGTQSKLAEQIYYSTKKEWSKASPYHVPPAALKFSKDLESSLPRKQSIKALRREKSVAKVITSKDKDTTPPANKSRMLSQKAATTIVNGAMVSPTHPYYKATVAPASNRDSSRPRKGGASMAE